MCNRKIRQIQILRCAKFEQNRLRFEKVWSSAKALSLGMNRFAQRIVSTYSPEKHYHIFFTVCSAKERYVARIASTNRTPPWPPLFIFWETKNVTLPVIYLFEPISTKFYVVTFRLLLVIYTKTKLICTWIGCTINLKSGEELYLNMVRSGHTNEQCNI